MYIATLFTGTYFLKRLMDNCNSGKYICLGDFKAEIHLYHLKCKIPFKKENVLSVLSKSHTLKESKVKSKPPLQYRNGELRSH